MNATIIITSRNHCRMELIVSQLNFLGLQICVIDVLRVWPIAELELPGGTDDKLPSVPLYHLP